MLVVAVPLQRTRFRHRPPQGSQTLAVIAPQGVPFAHAGGQLRVAPQASPTSPQYCCTPLALLHVTGTQPVPPTHELLLPHTQPLPAAEQSVPQLSEPPQLSPIVPQYRPPVSGLQVSGVQPAVGPALHRLPWQVHPLFVQVLPQSSEFPQPSPMVPQYWSPFAVLQVSGVQPAVGPALHRLFWQVHPGFVQVVPQCTVDPQPSPMSPQYWSPVAAVQVRGTQPAVGPALHRLF